MEYTPLGGKVNNVGIGLKQSGKGPTREKETKGINRGLKAI